MNDQYNLSGKLRVNINQSYKTHHMNWRRKFLDPVAVVAALESNVWVYVLEPQQLENEDHYRIFRFSALCLQSPAGD